MAEQRSKKRNPITGLTEREALFVAAFLRGQSGYAAYMELHPASNRATAIKEASRMLKRPHIAKHLAERQEAAIEAGVCAFADHLAALYRLRDKAASAGEYPSAVKAEELRGRASGHYVEHHKFSGAVATGFDPAKLAALPKADLDTLAGILEKLQ